MGLPVGTVTVASPGTRTPVVASGHAVRAVSFRARTSNAGAVFIGDEGVSAASGYCLAPGEELTFSFKEGVDLRRFCVDAEQGGDRVDFAGVSS